MQSEAIVGRVLRAAGGFYRVALPDGSIHECHLSGRLKARGAGGRTSPVVVGDLVVLDAAGDAQVLREVLPRRTELLRPSVANVDLCVMVHSVASPSPNPELLDRCLIQAERSGLRSIICLSKADLGSGAQIDGILSPYRNAGYECVVTSAVLGTGLPELVDLLKGKVVTLSGPSGVGKSRLLNAICPGLARPVGAVSERMDRGRHTTRQVELLPLPQGGWVADTPGFSVLDLADLTPRELPSFFPEFALPSGECRFADCVHRSEPGCSVVAAVSAGSVDLGRYERYLRLLEEIEAHEASRY